MERSHYNMPILVSKTSREFQSMPLSLSLTSKPVEWEIIALSSWMMKMMKIIGIDLGYILIKVIRGN